MNFIKTNLINLDLSRKFVFTQFQENDFDEIQEKVSKLTRVGIFQKNIFKNFPNNLTKN